MTASTSHPADTLMRRAISITLFSSMELISFDLMGRRGGRVGAFYWPGCAGGRADSETRARGLAWDSNSFSFPLSVRISSDQTLAGMCRAFLLVPLLTVSVGFYPLLPVGNEMRSGDQ